MRRPSLVSSPPLLRAPSAYLHPFGVVSMPAAVQSLGVHKPRVPRPALKRPLGLGKAPGKTSYSKLSLCARESKERELIKRGACLARGTARTVKLKQSAFKSAQRRGAQLLKGAEEGCTRGRVHKVKVEDIVDAQTLQHQCHGAEVCALNLRHRVLLHVVAEGPLREKAEALASGRAARTARALVCRRL